MLFIEHSRKRISSQKLFKKFLILSILGKISTGVSYHFLCFVFFVFIIMADNTHCSIVGLLGILIQVILGVLSFSVLIIKRHF